MSTQILTATNVLSQVELERLRLHAFRAPSVDEMMLDTDILDYIDFSKEIIRDSMDLESTKYIKDGDVFYSIMRFRNLESVISTLERFNQVEREAGISTGLIESDATNLEITFVYPTEVIDEVIQMNLAVYMKALKAAFYQ